MNKPKRVPFITTFNPSLPHISNIIKKHYNLLLSSDRCKNVFQHLPVVAFRCSPNLRDLLVTAKISSNSSNPQLPSGSFRCEKNCATCPYISHGLTTYTLFSTGETHPIKSNLTYETKNLIYMIQCNCCNLQYIGETKRRLKDRFNEHRRTIDNRDFKIWYGRALIRREIVKITSGDVMMRVPVRLSRRSLAFYYGKVSGFTYSSLREYKPAVYFSF